MSSTAALTATSGAPPLRLPHNRDCYYGGAWHKPRSAHYADTINPGTGASLGPVAEAAAADIDAAVAAARAAFVEWRNVLPLERAKLLQTHRGGAA